MPLPCLARLPVVATGTPEPKTSRGDGEEFFPAELWTKIVALAADANDPCTKRQIEELCEKQALATWLPSCKDGSLYDELNARFGWYGDLSSMADVLRKHGESLSKAANIPKKPDELSAKRYLTFMCQRRAFLERRFDDLKRDPEPVLGPNWNKGKLRATIREYLQGSPLDAPWVTALAKYVVDLDPQLLMLVPGSLVPLIIAKGWDLTLSANSLRLLERSDLMHLVPNSDGRIAGYAEVAMAAVTKDGTSLQYVPGARPLPTDGLSRHTSDIGEALEAYVGRYPEPVPNFAELATIAVRTTPHCLKYVPPEHEKWTEIAKAAVRANAVNLVDVPEAHDDYDAILGAANRAAVSRLAQQIGGLSEAAREKLVRALTRLAAQQQRETGGGGAS